MLPLRVVFLWHYHQPDYRWEGKALLPWVRFRAAKDYAVLFQLLGELPGFRCVLNLVPSLLLQLVGYARGELTDTAEQLSHRAPEPSEAEQRYWRMVMPPEPLRGRFAPLLELCRQLEEGKLSPEQWQDVRMWMQLVWMFPHRERFPVVSQWFQQGSHYRADELRLLGQLQRLLAGEALRELRQLLTSGQGELSCSPFYHPILPLVCDTESAQESDPELPRPEPPFRFPADAWLQCVRARQLCWELLGVVPEGMWPSEGALSMEALHQMAAAGVRWTATDEALFFAALPTAPRWYKYLPHRVHTPAGEVVVFFRDRELSDAIGFQYGSWMPERAVEDFCGRLWRIRSELVQSAGEQVLRTAVVLVALDGENCWDGYPDNGVAFLRLLAEQLRTEEWVVTTTCRALVAEGREPFPELPRVRPGSWVEGSLRIWVGTPANNAAWQALAELRAQLEDARSTLHPARWQEALEHLLCAEGSDWFWWRSPERSTPAAPLFERLFRLRLERARALLED